MREVNEKQGPAATSGSRPAMETSSLEPFRLGLGGSSTLGSAVALLFSPCGFRIFEPSLLTDRSVVQAAMRMHICGAGHLHVNSGQNSKWNLGTIPKWLR